MALGWIGREHLRTSETYIESLEPPIQPDEFGASRVEHKSGPHIGRPLPRATSGAMLMGLSQRDICRSRLGSERVRLLIPSV